MFAFRSDGGPRPRVRAVDEAGPDGIIRNVGERRFVVVFVVDHPRREALGEEGATAAVAGVVLARVVALEPLCGLGEILDAAVDDRVVVRSHQAVRVELEVPAARALLQQGHERASVLVVPEEHRVVDGAGRDMEVPVRELRAKHSRHASNVRLLRRRLRRSSPFRPTPDTPPRATTSVRHSSWPRGARLV